MASLGCPLLQRGWWCEATARSGQRTRIRTYRIARPERALIWMRTEVRTMLSGFSADDQERAGGWLDHGQWEAVYRLRAGETYTFSASVRTTRLTWSARPVLFLALCGPAGTSNPPSCAAREGTR